MSSKKTSKKSNSSEITEDIESSSKCLQADSCIHEYTSNLDGISVCDECGLKLDELLTETDKYYGATDSKWSKDPSRFHIRKETERSLYQDLETRGFPQRIIERSNDYYKKIIENKIYRANNRLAIVFACVFYAYIDFDEPQSSSELSKKFGLDRKGISNGFKAFSFVFRNQKNKKHIEPTDLIQKIISDLNVQDSNIFIDDIKKIYTFASENSESIRTSVPHSVAAGLVYYYLKLREANGVNAKDYNGENINCENIDYSKIVQLTDITFKKIATDISITLGSTEKVTI